MNQTTTLIKRALISVSNKTGIVEFAKGLHGLGVEIISTGGTKKALLEAGIPARDISDYTGFPEMMDGRVKTLHPKVHGGILGLRDTHKEVAETHGIQWIDLVICNLYPFSETIQKPGATEDEAIENIDIGGPTMIRSAAKNVGWVGVVVDPSDYAALLDELKQGGLSYETRKRLAIKAFGHTAQYDAIIHNYFTDLSSRAKRSEVERSGLTEVLNLTYTKLFDLRYGENPHQLAAVYTEPNNKGSNILNAKILQGKQLSYNNINDADGALSLLKEFTDPACVIVKHANPCGVAVGDNLPEVFERAYQADPLSAFGGIIALNRPCTKDIAEAINKFFVEIVIATTFESDALTVFAQKKNLRLLEISSVTPHEPHTEYRFVDGGLLVQDADTKRIETHELKTVTKKQSSQAEIKDMLFAWKVLKHMKSNAILIARDNTTVGVGVGQVSRVDAVDIAIKKAGVKLQGSILASDAFFPFRDSIDHIANKGITAIIQPGGSVKDEEVIAACDEHGIAMVFTGVRCFKH
ncbi:MAG: bifunctional phosphoribosylaminoimidazolecarboxamide formyltransferase/IMP cyclohydrolase [Patescibacteria group bacterium]